MSDNIHIKQPKTFEEQIEILKNRNLIIKNTKEAVNFLKRVNYYRFSAYGLTLKHEDNKDVFLEGTTFNQMKAIYNFDKRLREFLMYYLETIEIEFRTKIAYYHAHEFGPLGYKDSIHFEKEWAHTMFMKSLNKKIEQSGKELFVLHHKSKYKGEFPFWVAIEVTSFTDLSKLFRNLLRNSKRKIVKDYNIPHDYAISWLHALSYVRNICAHYGRLYGKKLIIKPRLFKDVEEDVENSRVFSVVYVINRLLSSEDRTNFIISLQALLEENANYIKLQEIGFPTNWESLLKRL